MLASLVAVAAWLAVAAPAPAGARSVLVATAVEPLRVDKLADALRTYLDFQRVEVRTAPAVVSGDLRADLGALAQAGAGEQATTVLRITSAFDHAVEIALTDLPSQRTIITTIPRSERDEDLYRTLALKVQGLLRVTEEQPTAMATVAAAPPASSEPSVVDVQGGLTAVSFPLGDVTQAGFLLRPRWAMTPGLRLSLGARVMPAAERRAGGTDVRMRAVPLVAGIERCWRTSRLELAVGFVVLAEIRYAEATAGPATRSDWAFVPGAGPSLAFGIRLGRAVRLSLQAAAIGLPWSSRYRVDGATVLDASRLQLPVDLTLDVGI
jgi:hypothetical protein